MYYITYGLFYLLSLIPWRVMYFIADIFYAIVYYGFGYRKAIVMKNLSIAFPEKQKQKELKLQKGFITILLI